MLLIILQIILLVFPIYTLIQAYKKEEENKTLKKEIKSLKEDNKMLIQIYAIDRQKFHMQQIDDLREELEQLRQEKWINI